MLTRNDFIRKERDTLKRGDPDDERRAWTLRPEQRIGDPKYTISQRINGKYYVREYADGEVIRTWWRAKTIAGPFRSWKLAALTYELLSC